MYVCYKRVYGMKEEIHLCIRDFCLVAAIPCFAIYTVSQRPTFAPYTGVMIGEGFNRNIFSDERAFNKEPTFDRQDLDTFKKVSIQMKAKVEELFGTRMYFTRPTYFSRINGSMAWEPTRKYNRAVYCVDEAHCSEIFR